MEPIMKQLRKLAVLFICACVALTTSSCSNDGDTVTEGSNYVYYIDKDYNKIVQKEYELNADKIEDKIEELLDRLKLNTEDVKVTKAIPDGVNIENYTLADGVLSLEFNADYGNMNKPTEVLTRAAVVLTMVQLQEVDYVSITVGGQPLTNAKGEPRGNMEASDFANNLDRDDNSSNTDDFTIYFANQKGAALLKYEFKTEYSSSTSKEQVIINKLIEGPGEQEGYVRTVPANVEVQRVVTMDNVCYITFGENFQTEQTNVSDELIIYSIVNSLSELPYIHKVQISIDGNPEAKFHSNLSLVEPFVRNLDYVEEPAETE